MANDQIQRLVVRTLLSLPSPILRAMSGGTAVYRGGRTLDPRLQFLSAMSARAPGAHTQTPEEARRSSAAGLAALSGGTEPTVRTEAIMIPDGERSLPARAYRPTNAPADAALIVYGHMGGGVIGDLETCDSFCQTLAAITRSPVLSVDYRLAPEHRFPAGLDDMMTAWRWARDNGARLGAPSGRMVIAGDSMGGNFAAILCQDLRRAGEAQPELQLLIYPCVDVASETASMTTYAEAFPLGRALMVWFMGHYMGPEDSPDDPRLSPLRETDLSGLAPAIVVTAGFDPLNDQGEAYAKRLKDAGVKVVFRCYDALAHGFTAFGGAIPAADVACREIAGLVREALEGRVR